MTAKDAYYFSHDANARNDTKILAMRCVYGSEGYGLFWMLVEMMREQSDYKLDIRSKYAYNAFAMQTQFDVEKLKIFISDCIDEFGLFESDGDYLWSTSLLRRMEIREEKSEKARQSIKKRWSKNSVIRDEYERNTNVYNEEYERNTNVIRQEYERNTIKGKERKGNRKESITTDIASLIQKYDIEVKGVYHLDQLQSYVGTLAAELIEEAFSRSKGKVSSYLLKILDDWNKNGHTKTSDVKTVSKEEKERQARQKYLDDEIEMNRRFHNASEPPAIPVFRTTAPF
jgi:hypothetical protein